MQVVLFWLIVAVPLYVFNYCNGANFSSRFEVEVGTSSLWGFYKEFFSKGLRLMRHDYFEVHCLWSWEKAKSHRLADMKLYLGSQGRDHEVLGHITAMDCDKPERQDEIAVCAYESRLVYWLKGLFQYLTSPLVVVFFILLIFIALILDIYAAVKNTLSPN